jgi:hypothetical protein
MWPASCGVAQKCALWMIWRMQYARFGAPETLARCSGAARGGVNVLTE